jgi:heat shock protein HslJ
MSGHLRPSNTPCARGIGLRCLRGSKINSLLRTLIVGYWLIAGGCALAANLLNTTWLVKDVGGHGAVGDLRPTIEFTADGHAGGRAGCNDWSASSHIDGAKLSFGPVATTRMACLPLINKQESRFIAALAATRAFRINTSGLLILFDEHNKTMMRASRM